MKIVAVSQRVDRYLDREETRDSLDQRLYRFISSAGFFPVAVPNYLCGSDTSQEKNCVHLSRWLEAINPKGFILSGGNDIGYSIERDHTETQLLDHASKCKLPVLGICRGMQMIGNWSGMDLKSVKEHSRTRHLLFGEISGEVNSYHKFALASCPYGYKVIAHSEDREIEAIKSLCLPWEAWMWHPEREPQFVLRDLQRLRCLFQ